VRSVGFDPIDGTKTFVRGVPVMATLIALLNDGVPGAGVASAPALQRRWVSVACEGAFASRSVRHDGSGPRFADLESASLSFSSLSGWAKLGLRDRFIELTDSVWRVRGYGDSCPTCLLAEGRRRHRHRTQFRVDLAR